MSLNLDKNLSDLASKTNNGWRRMHDMAHKKNIREAALHAELSNALENPSPVQKGGR